MNEKKVKSAIIVFAREPKDGKVKTRLSKDLPVKSVTRLYKAFIKDVLSVVGKSPCTRRFIYYAGNASSMPYLKKFKNQYVLKKQTGKGLGERMYKAFRYCQSQGYERIVIIGTDCLTMTSRDITHALKKLKSHDCVLGPSSDGGYYLIALKSPIRQLFTGIHWSTSSVLNQTLQKIKRQKKKVFLLKELEDIDTTVHLKRFLKANKSRSIASHTKKILEKTSLLSYAP